MVKMSRNPNQMPLSEVFEQIAHLCEKSEISIGELIDFLHTRGQMLVCLIFAAPFLLPIPLPGLSSAFGMVIVLAGMQVLFDRDFKPGTKWMSTKISTRHAPKIFRKAAAIVRKIDPLIKPRLVKISRSVLTTRASGLVLIILAVLLGLPMPPGFNAPPALAICLLAIGTIEEDGYLILLSWCLCFANICLFAGIFFYGFEGLKALFQLN
jgi:hypothetical protein